MNIFEEYALRKKISYPIAYHTISSLLILASQNCNSSKRLCVLTVMWNSNPHHPGVYTISLRSNSGLKPSTPQSLFHLSKTHFSLEKSWFEYEEFFYNWDPIKEGLIPVYGDDAFLAAWGIFVFANERWFLNQSAFVKKKLFETLDPSSTKLKRLEAISFLTSSSSFDPLRGLWDDKFVKPIEKDYMNWYSDFSGLQHANF